MWLRQLASDDEQVRQEAINNLAGSICHQGWICPATGYAVPYLIELLQEPTIQGKDEILELLADIAAADPLDEQTWRKNAEVPSWEVPAHIPFKDAHLAAEAGIPVYSMLLDAPELRVCMQAANALTSFPERAQELWVILQAAFEHEQHEQARANLILALGRLAEPPPERINFFLEQFQSNQSELCVFAAALVLAQLAKEEAPEAALQMLARVMREAPASLNAYEELACGGGYPWSTAMWSLYYFGPARLHFVLPFLEERLRQPETGDSNYSFDAEFFARLAFFILFEGPPKEGQQPRPAAKLTEQQRHILMLLLEREKLWKYYNFLELLKGFGLPAKREEMAAYLGSRLPSADSAQSRKEQPARPRSPDRFEQYRQRIQAAHPSLHIYQVKGRVQSESGQDDDVITTNGDLLFRFPRRADAVEAMLREIKLLHALQEHLPLPIPNPQYSSEDTSAIGFAFMGYPMLPGKPLSKELLESVDGEQKVQALADLLASFLYALHHLPVDQFAQLAPPDVQQRPTWKALYERVREALFPSMEKGLRKQIEARFEKYLGNVHNFLLSPALIHSNFSPETIIYHAKPQTISGIIDFSRACLGDPARDFAGLLGPKGYGESFVRRFEPAYPELPSLLERARFYAEALSLEGQIRRLMDRSGQAIGRMTFFPQKQG